MIAIANGGGISMMTGWRRWFLRRPSCQMQAAALGCLQKGRWREPGASSSSSAVESPWPLRGEAAAADCGVYPKSAAGLAAAARYQTWGNEGGTKDLKVV